MSLIQEISNIPIYKQPRATDNIGGADLTQKVSTDDIGFSTMRNQINTDGEVDGAQIADYLDRAAELNDEVDTVPFGLETDDGDIVKVYVNAEEADKFEEKMKQLLGSDEDIEEALNKLALEFDIIDVVWPEAKTDATPTGAATTDGEVQDLDDDEFETVAEYDDLTEAVDPDAALADAEETQREALVRLEAIVGQLNALGTGGVRVVTGLLGGRRTKAELIREHLASKYAADCATVRDVLQSRGVSPTDYPFWLAPA